jgi:hypothetical protein
MRNLFFRLEPEEFEYQFRKSTSERDIKQTIIVMMITVLALIIFVILELQFLDREEILQLWVPSRIITAALLIVGIVLL